MKIEFCIPKNESIPTNLRLKVDDKFDVCYERLSKSLAYRFSFYRFQGVDCFLADDIMDQIVRQMREQAYDLGACLEEISREFDADANEIGVTVFFKKRGLWQ